MFRRDSKISDNEDKLFLQAFYYRQIGKNNYALEKLDTLLAKKPDFSKAKREKVLVLKNLQQFEDAKDLAKETIIFILITHITYKRILIA